MNEALDSAAGWPEKAALSQASGEYVRRLGWICYGALAAGLVLYIVTIWIEVFLDTRKAPDFARSVFDESHRHWRVRTTFMFLIWSILGGLTLPLGIGWLFVIPAYAWYLFRIAIGMIQFARGKPIGLKHAPN
ncbi:MAG: hypothetical protein P8124_02165 [Gammaproteobacteria bacterium]